MFVILFLIIYKIFFVSESKNKNKIAQASSVPCVLVYYNVDFNIHYILWGEASSLNIYYQIFQQLANDALAAAGMPPSVSILEAHNGPIKGLQFEAGSGDPSALAGASVLASFSNLGKELSLVTPPRTDEDNHVMDAEMKGTSDDNDRAGASLSEKAVVPSSDNGNENLNGGNTIGLDASVDAGIRKASEATHELRPFLRILAGSSASDFDLSGSISKILDERREIRELIKDFEPPISISTKRQAFKESLQQGVISSNDIEVSFENFPYYLRFYFWSQSYTYIDFYTSNCYYKLLYFSSAAIIILATMCGDLFYVICLLVSYN